MRLKLIRAALTGSDPVRAALAGLIIMASNELDTPDLWVHSRSAWDDAIANAEQALADEPAVPEEGREPATWTEGVCGDGAALLKDGVMVPIEAVVRELNEGARARAVLARWGNLKKSLTSSPPADGEVAEFVAQLSRYAETGVPVRLVPFLVTRAAELLQRQALVPVPVSEQPWEREGWCDGSGRCWSSSSVLPDVPAWIYGPAAWAERFPDIHRLLLPAHALPLPEVNNG